MGSVEPFRSSQALVVGIDAYGQGIAPLRTAVADATALADCLEGSSHAFQVERCLEDQATRAGLEEALAALAERVGAEDRLLVYFAGHGIALDDDDGPAGYLVPQDASLEAGSASFLPMLRVHELLHELPCRHLLLVLDCCFAGSFRWASTRSFAPEPKILYRKRYERFLSQPAWQVLTSAGADQTALDSLSSLARSSGAGPDARAHSPFAGAFLAALRGEADLSGAKAAPDGVVTATELYLYLRDRVEPAAEGVAHAQTPGLWPLRKHGRGEFLFHVPGQELRLEPDPPLTLEANPWRGLEAYDDAHAELFFGRGRVVEALAARLEQADVEEPLLAVVGASGTGKSSVVRAGLVPRARASGWQVCGPVRPRDDPTLARSARELAALAAGRRLLIIDQLEELFTQVRASASAFFQRLEELLGQASSELRVVVTLRADFEPQLANTPLGPRLSRARFRVAPLTPEELREVIEGPAEKRVLHFDEPRMVDELVSEVVATPGGLPLLSFTLSALYLRYLEERGELDRALKRAHYLELGGVAGALNTRASQLWELASEPEQRSIRELTLRMIAVEGGELARRRVGERELRREDPAEDACLTRVVERYVGARLMVRGTLGDESYVEPAHDMLVRAWEKAHMWRDEVAGELPLRRAFGRAAGAWERGARDRGLLWDRDPRLDALVPQPARPPAWLNRRERAFLRASLDLRRRRRLLRQLLLQAAVITLGAWLAGLSVLHAKSRERALDAVEAEAWARSEALAAKRARARASDEATAADQARARADRARARAEDQLAVALEERGRNAAAQRRWAQAAVLQAEALVRGETPERRSWLLQALRRSWRRHPLQEPGRTWQEGSLLALQPGGSLLAAPAREGGVGTWRLPTGEPGPLLEVPAGVAVTALAWTPGGELLGVALGDGSLRLWTPGQTPARELTRLSEGARCLAWSPDGSRVAAYAAGAVEVWSRRAEQLAGFPRALRSQEAQLAWSPDGAFLSAQGFALRVWETAGWTLAGLDLSGPQEVVRHRRDPRAIGWAPDAPRLALLGNTWTLLLDARDGRRLGPLRHRYSSSRLVAWEPQGGRLVRAREEELLLWSPGDRHAQSLRGHEAKVVAVSWDRAGRLLASADYRGAVRVWDGETLHPVAVLEDTTTPQELVWAPSGSALVVRGNKGSLQLWRDDDLHQAEREASAEALAWSPDARWIARGAPGGAQLWERDQVVAPARRLLHRGSTRIPERILWSPRGDRLLLSEDEALHVAGRPAWLRLWSWPAGEELAAIPRPPVHFELQRLGGVPAAAWADDGSCWALADGARVRLFDREGHEQRVLRGPRTPLAGVAWVGDRLAALSSGVAGDPDVQEPAARLWLWDPRSGELLWERGLEGQGTWLQVAPGGARLLTRTASRKWDRSTRPVRRLQLWDALGAPVATLPASFNLAAWSPDGALLAAEFVLGNQQGGVLLFDGATGELLGQAAHHRDALEDLSWSPDGSLLASASSDRTVRLWHPRPLRPLATLRGGASPMVRVTWSPDGRFLLAASLDGVVRLWRDAELRASPEDLLALAEAHGGLRLEKGRVVRIEEAR